VTVDVDAFALYFAIVFGVGYALGFLHGRRVDKSTC